MIAVDKKTEMAAVEIAACFYKEYAIKLNNVIDIDDAVNFLEEAVYTFDNKIAHFRRDSDSYRTLDTTLNIHESNPDVRYTVYFAVGGDYPHSDASRYLEDLAMAKYKLSGGKMGYTPDFIKSLKKYIQTGKFDFLDKTNNGVVR